MELAPADVAYRILNPVDGRTLAEITYPEQALENIVTTPLPDGAICSVLSPGARYRLSRASARPAAADLSVVAPNAGGGRWLLGDVTSIRQRVRYTNPADIVYDDTAEVTLLTANLTSVAEGDRVWVDCTVSLLEATGVAALNYLFLFADGVQVGVLRNVHIGSNSYVIVNFSELVTVAANPTDPYPIALLGRTAAAPRITRLEAKMGVMRLLAFGA